MEGHLLSEVMNMTIAEIKKNAETKMGQSLEALKNNLGRIRTGRPSPQLLDVIQVEYYGSMVPLSQVANVTLLDSRTISVQPWEKGMGAKIEKAIRESGLGNNPQLNGTIIMLPIPELNEERRRDLTRVAAQYAEHARVAIRNVRRDGMDQIKKGKTAGMSEEIGRAHV